MVIKVFVLGRPGSGKSTAARYLLDLAVNEGYKVERIKDYPILHKMYQEDREGKFRHTEYDGFDVLDLGVFDYALKQLEGQLETPSGTDDDCFMTIEFARDEYLHSLSHFSPEFLQGTYFLFIDAELETCIQRIHTRVLELGKPDCHFVSDYIMRAYYHREADWDFLKAAIEERFGVRKAEVIKNIGDLSNLFGQVSEFAKHIFLKPRDEQNGLSDLAIAQNK